MGRGDVSTVLDMLPTSVRSGISAFASLRRSDCTSTTSSRRRVMAQAAEELVITRREESRVAQVYQTASEAEIQVATPRQGRARVSSGIRWRYADQGMNINHAACLEKEDAAFSRKSFIDGVTYMLMALPDDLSDQEVAAIRAALPSSVGDTSRAGGGHGRAIGCRHRPESRTALHRCVASLVAILVILVHLALSCAAIVARVGAHYERKHNISQQIATRGIVVATALTRHGVVLSTKICAMKDGYVGKTLGNLAIRTVEGVTAGIQEGIGQGLLMVDERSRPS
ncbi:hypothetical protein F4802DRAFT_266263 [Xylaria palmicola]|nr:hypothetical protein F4802DRAFT_266263 [Xylaria palmicola]